VREHRDAVRLVAAGVVILSFVALAVLAIAASRSSFSLSAPAATEGAPRVQPALPAVPNLVSFTSPPASTPTATAPPAAVPAATPIIEPSAAPPVVSAGVPCPALGLPAPEQVGGLQSLIALVPLFGPFSAEAFALMPAFQPGFDALGPLFPVFEQGLDQAAPLLAAITPTVQQIGQAGFGVLAPLYGPYRQDVLAAEAQLAAALQPIIDQLASVPGSECLIALEGVLAAAIL